MNLDKINDSKLSAEESKKLKISNLRTRPNSTGIQGGRGLTGNELKEAHDAYSEAIRKKHNALVDEIVSLFGDGESISDIAKFIMLFKGIGGSLISLKELGEHLSNGTLDAVTYIAPSAESVGASSLDPSLLELINEASNIDLSAYLKKMSQSKGIYARDNGDDIGIPYNSDADSEALSIVQRDSEKRIKMLDPISDAHGATKKYVDDSVKSATANVSVTTEKIADGAVTFDKLSGNAKDTIHRYTDNGITDHNVSQASHQDIRLLIEALTSRLNALADSDDITLDQMSEIMAYIKANRGLIESVTTLKVNVADIIDNLSTSSSNKPLSAAQGVALKRMIDTLTASDVGAEPSGASLNEVSKHNNDEQAHPSIRAKIENIPTDMVRYSKQTLTEEQKAQVRENIGAINKELDLGLSVIDGQINIEFEEDL